MFKARRRINALLIIATLIPSPALCDDKSSIETTVRNNLIDGYSAHFRGVHRHGQYGCGEVNAKNQFGGYTGFFNFVTQGSTVVIYTEEDMEAAVMLHEHWPWVKYCGGK